jgi:hypothetical protein
LKANLARDEGDLESRANQGEDADSYDGYEEWTLHALC